LIAFKPAPLGQHHDFFQPELKQSIRQAATTYSEELKGHKLSFSVFKQAPWYLGSKFIVERSQLTLRMPYFDNDLIALSFQAPPELAESNLPALQIIAEGNPALGSIATDQGLAARSLPGFRAARHLFEQFTFKAEYAYDYGMPQWLASLDHAFSPFHLERLFLGQHKFHHFRIWYRNELSQYVEDILLDSRTRSRPYLHANRLEEMIKGHTKGNRNYTLEIHKLLSVELLTRPLIEQKLSNRDYAFGR
jgi:asparagine synthase (glutamine-hydrolysing)